MKRFFRCTTAVFLMVCLMGLAGTSVWVSGKCHAAEMGPVLTTATPLVKISKDAEVVIMGTGFKPGQALGILFTAAGGSVANIGIEVKPEAKADKNGSFACTWKAGTYIRRKLIKGGAFKIEVTDADYNPLAHSVVFFAEEKKDKKK